MQRLAKDFNSGSSGIRHAIFSREIYCATFIRTANVLRERRAMRFYVVNRKLQNDICCSFWLIYRFISSAKLFCITLAHAHEQPSHIVPGYCRSALGRATWNLEDCVFSHLVLWHHPQLDTGFWWWPHLDWNGAPCCLLPKVGTWTHEQRHAR